MHLGMLNLFSFLAEMFNRTHYQDFYFDCGAV
jgi:hypothetical protein